MSLIWPEHSQQEKEYDPPEMWHLQLPLPEVNDDEGNPWPTLSATDDKRLILGLLA